jgi:hypothetical protein
MGCRHNFARINAVACLLLVAVLFAPSLLAQTFYAEQTGRQDEALGNFPQAFTHLALILIVC